MHNIARYPSHNAKQLFELLDEFYPVPEGKRYRDVAFVPYLFYAPSAWTLSLVYSGGGFYAVGGAAIDVEGNFWTNNKWMPGSQTTIPDGRYELKSFSADEGRGVVTAFAVFSGTQTGPGPVDPPTGKSVAADYVYAMEFDGDRIRHMTKIWNDVRSLRDLGWA
jgi:hypothetical protein